MSREPLYPDEAMSPRLRGMPGPDQTPILVVAPDDAGQLLASMLSTDQLARTPLGPTRLVWAHTVEDGLAKLGSEPFEACIVDSSIGAGTIAFLRHARRQAWRRPLLLCTSVGEHDLVAAAQAAGATDVLVKTSVSLNTLGRVLQAAIQRSRFEETLRFGEEMLRILVEGTRDYAICMLDREGRVLTWNQGAERITGYSQGDVLGRHVSMLFPEEERAQLRPAAVLREAVSHGRHEEEGWRVRKDGTRYRAHVVVTPLYGEESALRGFSMLSRDVTAQHEAALQWARQSQPRIQAFQATPLGTTVTRRSDGMLLDANDAFCRLVGYAREEVVGRPSTDLADLWPVAGDRERLAGLLDRDGACDDLALTLQDRSGRLRRVRVSARLVRINEEPCVVATVEDVTVARYLEEQVHRRESRLREAERIAGVASWEWDIASGASTWSPNLYALLGLDPATTPPTLSSYLARVHPDDRDGLARRMAAIRAAPAPFEDEHRILLPDGTVRRMRSRGAISHDGQGKPARMMGTVQDVTPPEPRADDPARTLDRGAPEASRATDATRLGSPAVVDGWRDGPKLILVNHGDAAAVFPLPRDRQRWSIGRGAEADVAIGTDPYLSRRGAGIVHDGDAYFLEDLAPERNGTYLNGRRLGRLELAPLADGDIVGVGRSIFVFRSA
jgi:PAS domain S-box-containing protein